jgi:hypothetical protein
VLKQLKQVFFFRKEESVEFLEVMVSKGNEVEGGREGGGLPFHQRVDIF